MKKHLTVSIISTIEKTGGVSKHTLSIVRWLNKLGISVKIYNTSPSKLNFSGISEIIKIYRKTIGSLIFSHTSKDEILHIHAGGSFWGFIPAFFAMLNKPRQKKIIITYHGISMIQNAVDYVNAMNPVKKLIGKIYLKIFKYALDNSNAFIVVSERQKQFIIKHFGSQYSTKLLVIYNGYDPTEIRAIPKGIARKKLGFPTNKKIVLNLSNLVETKGHKYLILAMKHVITQRKDVMLIIAGKGPLQKDLEELTHRLNLSKYIIFTGFVPDEILPYLFSSADIFTMASLEEGTPTVMFEALGAGLPFVGTSVGGIPEIISSNDYGLLCPPADPECLAEKILIALDKEWDREKIRKYAEQFTWENITKRLVSIYNNIIKEE